MEQRKLPIGIQSFEDLRKNHYLYVDKTEYIWNLVNTGKTYFLSRPRRFGKSLFLTTMEAYFQGKKDLFRGLAIEKHENGKGAQAWSSYPVILFSLAGGEYLEKDGLAQALNSVLSKYEKMYHLETDGLNLSSRFRNLIENMAEVTGKQVVVLVDEYDKPLLDTMNVNAKQEEENRQLYSSFFSVLKDEDAHLRFIFITGVTKFAKVSVFSGLNQPRDISLSKEYSCICGITQSEMEKNFHPEIEQMAADLDLSYSECLERLEKMYDGYHFSRKSEGIYNPYSLLNAFQEREFSRYWFSTGTPSFLIRMLEKADYTPESLSNGVAATEDILRDYRGDSSDPVPLAYQAGYLTIREYDADHDLYILGFPNEEVEYGYLNDLAPSLLGGRETDRTVSFARMNDDLLHGNIDSFMTQLQSIFASASYTGKALKYEDYWQREIFLILKLLGQRVQCEPHTALGRADCLVETHEYVYVFEFKMNKSAEDALKQIESKGYTVPYKADHRTVYEIGVRFSSEKRNIENWKVLQYIKTPDRL